MLKRYWFVFYPEDRYGPRNAGVTAVSREDAKELVLKNFDRIKYSEPLKRLEEKKDLEVIEDINVQLLDKDHVLPNIGPVIFRGIWFPRLNLYQEV
jgi:hypothetical protein